MMTGQSQRQISGRISHDSGLSSSWWVCKPHPGGYMSKCKQNVHCVSEYEDF